MAYFNTTDLTPAELENLAFLRARRSGINEDVEVKVISCRWICFLWIFSLKVLWFRWLFRKPSQDLAIIESYCFQEIRSELDGINAQLATIDIPDEELVFVKIR